MIKKVLYCIVAMNIFVAALFFTQCESEKQTLLYTPSNNDSTNVAPAKTRVGKKITVLDKTVYWNPKGTKAQKDYVLRFLKVAKKEYAKFNILPSISLAQGILESNSGNSRLAQTNNNHFGVKCFSKSCKKGHCSNFTDDSHKDFFVVYKSAWHSWRGHSLLLNKKYAYKSSDYRAFAEHLQKKGYATDKNYAKSLCDLIEELDLTKFD